MPTCSHTKYVACLCHRLCPARLRHHNGQLASELVEQNAECTVQKPRSNVSEAKCGSLIPEGHSGGFPNTFDHEARQMNLEVFDISKSRRGE